MKLPETSASAATAHYPAGPGSNQDTRATPRVRNIADSRELRALAHPVRFALLDLLAEGPLTATQCADRLGETPANCSYHLRQLAKYGHVFAEEGGRGRERPWRMREEAISWDPHSPAGAAAASVLGEAVDRYRFDAWRRFQLQAAKEPPEWRDSALSTDVLAWMTATELGSFTRDLDDLFAKYSERRAHPEQRPDGARLVRFFAYAYGGYAGPLSPDNGTSSGEASPR